MSGAAQFKLGKIIGPDEVRDAVHIAVAPVVAGDFLSPGQHVGFHPNGKVGPTGTSIGIVDPFLTRSIYPNDRFFLFLYPNSITALHHTWSHPAFDETPSESVSPKEVDEEDEIRRSWPDDFYEEDLSCRDCD